MKPCPFCNAALNDNVAVTPTDPFCGACGRNSAAVRQSPTLPEGALAFQPAQPGGFGQQEVPPSSPQFGQQGTGGPQIGVPPGGQQFGNTGSGPQIGVPPGGGQQFGGQQVGGNQFGGQQGGFGQQVGGQQFGGQQFSNQQFNGQSQTAPPGLNWGGFLAPFVWGPANGVWIGLLSLVGFFPVLWLVSLGVSIYLLVKGNELAWKSKQWQSVQEFQAVQKNWVTWGIGIFIAQIVIGLMIGSAQLRAMQGGGGMPAGLLLPGFFHI